MFFVRSFVQLHEIDSYRHPSIFPYKIKLAKANHFTLIITTDVFTLDLSLSLFSFFHFATQWKDLPLFRNPFVLGHFSNDSPIALNHLEHFQLF